MANPPTADYMAKILALPPNNHNMGILMTAKSNWNTLCDSNPQPILATLFRDFSAKYLIPLLDQFDEVSGSHSTLYSDVLRAVSRNCYWGRFQTTHPRGRAILVEHAKRIAETARSPIREDKANFSQSVMLLWQFLAWDQTWGPTRVPDEYAKPIIRLIEEFLRDCPGAMGTSIGEDCMLLLKGPDQGSIFRVNMQRAQWESEIVACFCGVNEGLLRCSKCKIVAYCSPAHQRSDWPKHKKRCFRASFD